MSSFIYSDICGLNSLS